MEINSVNNANAMGARPTRTSAQAGTFVGTYIFPIRNLLKSHTNCFSLNFTGRIQIKTVRQIPLPLSWPLSDPIVIFY